MIGVIVRNLVSCAYHETIIVVAFAICFQAYYLSSTSVIWYFIVASDENAVEPVKDRW